jgi:uncharacterized membrane protein
MGKSKKVPLAIAGTVLGILALRALRERRSESIDTEVARTEDADRPSEQAEDGDGRIGHDEIRGRALELNPSRTSYFAMSVLSAIVATAGLLLDSPAIVVGSMVIGSQIGSVLAGSVGIAIGDGPPVGRGFVEQVGQRVSPGFLSMTVGLCAGAAGDLATNTQRHLDQPVSVSVAYRDQQRADSSRRTHESGATRRNHN